MQREVWCGTAGGGGCDACEFGLPLGPSLTGLDGDILGDVIKGGLGRGLHQLFAGGVDRLLQAVADAADGAGGNLNGEGEGHAGSE